MGAFDDAIAELEAGRPDVGHRKLLDHVASVQAEHGDGLELAAALAELAQFRLSAGDLRASADAMQAAVAIPLPEEHRAHALTLALNHGELLSRIGRCEEAIPLLEENVRGREALHGEKSPAVAYARIPLGACYHAVGRTEDAVAQLRIATASLWDDGNARFGQAIGHLALIEGPQVFQGVAGTSTRVHEDLVWTLDSVMPEIGAERRIAALGGAAEWLDATGYGAGQPRLQALAMITNLARGAGLQGPRVNALLHMHQIALQRGDQGLAVQTMLGLALAESEADDIHAAEASYNLAISLAADLGVDVQSDVQRNYGLFLAEIGRLGAAEAALRRAVELADAPDALGMAELSYGIFAQHQGRPDEAALLLKAGLDKLPADHPDRAFGEDHLQAVRERRACRCGETRDVGAELTAYVQEKMPGIVARITVSDGNPNVELVRQPSNDEMGLLRTIVQEAWQRLAPR